MYLLDANVFIQAKNLHYGFDFVPAFWDWLIRANAEGIVASIQKVSDELRAGGDELSEWVASRGEDFFLTPDTAVTPALRRVGDWISTQHYDPAAVSTFLQVADYWLVAHALAYNHVIVTHEVPAQTIRKIKIPNACIGLNIRCITPYAMLRQERTRFVLLKPNGSQR